MKIVIFGGSGFVGQGIVNQLAQDKSKQITIISRSKQNKNYEKNNITWFVSDISNDTNWQTVVNEADWVIDCIGILLPNPLKNQSYYSASTKPAEIIINYLASLKENQPRFLFVSAKKIPWPMVGYANSKATIEDAIHTKLPATKSTIIYPTIIYDKSRNYSLWLAKLVHLTAPIPLVKKITKNYQPINRKLLVKQIEQVINEKPSFITTRSYNPYKELF